MDTEPHDMIRLSLDALSVDDLVRIPECPFDLTYGGYLDDVATGEQMRNLYQVRGTSRMMLFYAVNGVLHFDVFDASFAFDKFTSQALRKKLRGKSNDRTTVDAMCEHLRGLVS